MSALAAGHPAWCSLEHCYRTDDGVRVHQQALSCIALPGHPQDRDQICPDCKRNGGGR